MRPPPGTVAVPLRVQPRRAAGTVTVRPARMRSSRPNPTTTWTRDLFTQPLERILRDAVTESTADVRDPNVTATASSTSSGGPTSTCGPGTGVALRGVLRSR